MGKWLLVVLNMPNTNYAYKVIARRRITRPIIGEPHGNSLLRADKGSARYEDVLHTHPLILYLSEY